MLPAMAFMFSASTGKPAGLPMPRARTTRLTVGLGVGDYHRRP